MSQSRHMAGGDEALCACRRVFARAMARLDLCESSGRSPLRHPTVNKPHSPPSRPVRTLRVELTASTVLRVLFACASVWLLITIWPILLVIVVALMIAGALGPAVTWFERRGLGRGAAIAVVFGGVFASVAAFAALSLPNLVAQLSDIVERLPRYQWQLAALLEKHRLTAPLAASVEGAQTTQLAGRAAQEIMAYSGAIVEVVAYGVASVFLALYLVIDRDRMRGSLFALIPRRYHVRTSRVLLNLETIVGGYVRGQVITSVAMAVFTFVVLAVAGAPHALTIAVFAGLTDVLPYIGGLLALIPAVFAASAKGLPVAGAVLAAIAIYQELESRIIVPRVYGHVLRLSSAVVMVALLIGGAVLGILGALLALPIAAAIRMMTEELRVELPGQRPENSVVRKLDAREERIFERLAAGASAEEAATIAAKIAEARFEIDAARGVDPTDVPLDGDRPTIE
jgi:predicted PurR-regulated permease PerM